MIQVAAPRPQSRLDEVRVATVGEVVLLRHFRAPGLERARGEVAALEHAIVHEGATALIVWIDEAIPPPSFEVLRLFLRIPKIDPGLEHIAVVVPQAGFSLAIASSVIRQLLRLTRLAGAVEAFTELLPTCAWLSRHHEGIDALAIEERLYELGRD